VAAVNDKVPFPPFVTLSDEGAGSAPPAVPLKLRLAGDAARIGEEAGEFTVKVTLVVAGEPEAPVALTVIWPL
jgi:hypothetical protein